MTFFEVNDSERICALCKKPADFLAYSSSLCLACGDSLQSQSPDVLVATIGGLLLRISINTDLAMGMGDIIRAIEALAVGNEMIDALCSNAWPIVRAMLKQGDIG